MPRNRKQKYLRYIKQQRFTLLELLIAVLILVIISTVIVGVFRETLRNYKKGMSYSEISDSLAGSFIVMESDLSKMLPLGDKETVYFNEKSFSFVALEESTKKKSSLTLIRYKVDEKMKVLYRSEVKYPSEKQNIDEKNIAFLDGVLTMDFSYTYQKPKDKKDDKKKNTSKLAKTKKDDNTKLEEKEIKKESPKVIIVNGRVKNGEIVEDFSTAFFVTRMETGKPEIGTGTDTGKKKLKEPRKSRNERKAY